MKIIDANAQCCRHVSRRDLLNALRFYHWHLAHTHPINYDVMGEIDGILKSFLDKNDGHVVFLEGQVNIIINRALDLYHRKQALV